MKGRRRFRFRYCVRFPRKIYPAGVRRWIVELTGGRGSPRHKGDCWRILNYLSRDLAVSARGRETGGTRDEEASAPLPPRPISPAETTVGPRVVVSGSKRFSASSSPPPSLRCVLCSFLRSWRLKNRTSARILATD